jgi:hypothetical protein
MGATFYAYPFLGILTAAWTLAMIWAMLKLIRGN